LLFSRIVANYYIIY
jgi:hypothetical protein